MKILVNGCSHTKLGYTTLNQEGDFFPPEEHNTSWQRFLAQKLEINHILGIHGLSTLGNRKIKIAEERTVVPFSLIYSWNKTPCMISLATDGKGNDSIMMDTLTVLRGLEKINKRPDLVLIQFSGPTRRLVSTDKFSYAYSTPYENYEFGINFEPVGSYLTLHNMVILQDYLKKGNYKYYFLNYFGLDKSVEDEEIYNEIDLSHFITYKDNHPIFDGWLDRIKKDNLAIDEQGHPNLQLQSIIADKFYKKIVQDKIIL